MDKLETRYQRFGHLIQDSRLARGLSRKEVAEYIDVQPSFYRRVERGIALLALLTFATSGGDCSSMLALYSMLSRWKPQIRSNGRASHRGHG